MDSKIDEFLKLNINGKNGLAKAGPNQGLSEYSSSRKG